MWWNRLLIAISVATIAAGTSLSTGSGKAAALGPEEVIEAADEVAPIAASTLERVGLGALGKSMETIVKDVKSLFIPQVTKLTPAVDTTELASAKTAWKTFTPRMPAAEEVVPMNGKLPSIYQEASHTLCRTAFELLNDPNPTQSGWQRALNIAYSEALERNPDGKKLAIYNDLNEINNKFQEHCVCAATAELEVFFAKETLCE